MKPLLSALLTFLAVCAATPASAMAAEEASGALTNGQSVVAHRSARAHTHWQTRMGTWRVTYAPRYHRYHRYRPVHRYRRTWRAATRPRPKPIMKDQLQAASLGGKTYYPTIYIYQKTSGNFSLPSSKVDKADTKTKVDKNDTSELRNTPVRPPAPPSPPTPPRP